MLDATGQTLEVGQNVAVAFAASSSARLRLGKISELHHEWNQIRVVWDADGKESPWVKVYPHGVERWRRVVVLNG